MLDIIIVFIVISMIVANILKYMGSPGEWSKPDASGGPAMPRGPGVPGQSGDGRDIYRRPSREQVQMSGIKREDKTHSTNQRPVAGGYADKGEDFSVESPFGDSLEGMSQEGLRDMPYNDNSGDENAGAIKLEIISSDVKRHTLSFSRHAIINGIIMSELLQPPKALRKRTM